MNNPRPLAATLAVLACACLCIFALGIGSYYFFAMQRAEIVPNTPLAASTAPGGTPTPTTASPREPLPSPTPPAADTPSPTPQAASPPATSLSPEIIALMETIQQQVIEERGLQPAGEFTRVLYTRADLASRVENDFFAEYTEQDAASDALILSILGLLPPGFDLITLYTDLFSEQIAGFYDDETGEMVVVQEGGFRGPEKLTYAHEYTHALQDQNFNFDGALGYNDETCETDSERCAAIQALFEGDASLLELQWFLNYATQQDADEILDYYNSISSPVFESLPPYLQDDFVFPYNQGYTFVESLFNTGGWPAVDAAYASPPVSTEQILHPEKYPGDAPIPVHLPDLLPTLGAGWEQYDDNVMGEWYTWLILARGVERAYQLDEDQAAAAAAGWGGDRYAAYLHPETGRAAFVIVYAWDTPADEAEFAEAAAAYGDARYGSRLTAASGSLAWQGEAGFVIFHASGGRTIWITAPDQGMAESLLAALLSN